MDPTSPLGYISGYPGAPTFSAGWTSNQAPTYPFPGWAGAPNVPGMTMAGRYGPSQMYPQGMYGGLGGMAGQDNQAPGQQPAQPANTQPQAAPASAADNNANSQFDVGPLMGMIPSSGMLGLMGMLGGIPNSAGMSMLSALNQPQGGGTGGNNNTNPYARNLALAGMGLNMMAPRYYNPDNGQWSTGGSMFGSLAGR